MYCITVSQLQTYFAHASSPRKPGMPNAQQRWGCKGLGGIPSGLGVFHKTSPNWLRDTATQKKNHGRHSDFPEL